MILSTFFPIQKVSKQKKILILCKKSSLSVTVFQNKKFFLIGGTIAWDGDSFKKDSFTLLIPEIYSKCASKGIFINLLAFLQPSNGVKKNFSNGNKSPFFRKFVCLFVQIVKDLFNHGKIKKFLEELLIKILQFLLNYFKSRVCYLNFC